MTTGNTTFASELKALADAWATAEREQDAEALAGLLTDDFAGIGPVGFVLNRDQWLARHQGGVLRHEDFTFETESTRTYGDVGILVGEQAQKATFQGHDSSGAFRATLVAVRSEGAWRLANIQLSGRPPGSA